MGSNSQPQVVDLFAKLILLVAEDSDHWEQAADSCENFIQCLSRQNQEKMALNCAVYRERAALLRNSVTDIMDQIDGHEPKAAT